MGWIRYRCLRRSFTDGRSDRNRFMGMFLFYLLPPLFWKPLTTSRKEEGPEYPPPRPFLPLTNSTWQNQLPNLFHAFFNARQEAGQGFQDEGFDHSHSQIGSLGQIVIKAPPLPKKKVEVERKKKVAKVV
jgi:hypothetical protein